MDESKKGALRKHHQGLRTGLLVGNILPVLRPVLTDSEYSRIRYREDNVSRVDELIEILLTKKDSHFDTFCVTLEKNGYEQWAKTLQKEVEKLEVPAASPFSALQFLETYEDEFLEVVDPKQGLLKLKHKGVIPADVKTAIETANDEDAKFILFEHLQRHATVDTLRVYCDVAIAASGFPKMQELGRKITNALSPGANGFPRMQELGRKIMDALSPGGPEENDPPLSQTQVQFPIIDELADDFALLMVDVKRELRSLSDSRLQDVKELVEEKLKSKGTPIQLPSSATKLISTISKYWNCLSFELAQLVIRYLDKEDLQAQLKRYEENLRRKGEVLLTQCRGSNIAPRVPPDCFSMQITVDEDPYSFSLHHILEFKDFLVHRIGMNIALFTGWDRGSIILHFCILEYDMETAVRQLYAHKLELRAMQVVAIEVGDVIVYRDAPIERPPSITDVSSKIDDLAAAMQTGGLIVSKAPAFGSAVSAVVENAQGFLGAAKEEVKNNPQVKTALRAVKSGAESASCFLDKVVDIFYYCQSDAIATAIQGLGCSVPDLMPLRILMGLLGKSLAQAVTNYSEVEVACNAAIHTCSDKELHAQMSRLEELVARGFLGTWGVTAGALGTVAVVGGLLTGGIGALVVGSLFAAAGAHATYLALQPDETAFSRISGNFDSLKKVACGFRGGVTHVHATVKEIATQVGNIYGVDKGGVKPMIHSLECLKRMCTASYESIARSKEDVRSKTRDLPAEI